MYLTEGISDTVIVYILLKKLTKPFTEWEAYKLGIIDKNGKKLKDPKTPEELKSWSILTRLIWKVKKLMIKFLGKSKLAAYLTAAYLLKDSYTTTLLINKSILKEATEYDIKSKDLYILKQVINMISFPQEKIFLNDSLKDNQLFDLYTNVFIKIYNNLNKNKVSKENLLKEFHHTIMTTMGDGFIDITTDDVFDPKFFVKDPYAYQFGKDPKTAEKDIKQFDKTHKPEFNTSFYNKWLDYANKKLINIEPDKSIKDVELHGKIDKIIFGNEIKDGLEVFYVNHNDYDLINNNKNKILQIINKINNKHLVEYLNQNNFQDFYIKYKNKFLKIQGVNNNGK